jgi:hypothetical protein
MSRYLLSCACGQTAQVETRQAGQQVVCQCGKKLDVPPLRQLRELPLAPGTDEHVLSAWTARHGVITAALVLAMLLAIVGGYSWYTGPSPLKFDPELRTRVVEQGIAGLSPADGWRMWVNSYLTLARQGLQEFPAGNEQAFTQETAKHRIIAAAMLIPAGILIAVAIVAAAWRK